MTLEDALSKFDELKKKSLFIADKIAKNENTYNTQLLNESIELAETFQNHINFIIEKFSDYYNQNKKYMDALLKALKQAHTESVNARKAILN